MEPTVFQNYKILNLIGEGSFGKVFKAAEVDTNNVVALKILLKVIAEICCLLVEYF